MDIGHAHEATATQRRLPPDAVTEVQRSADDRMADVDLVPVVDQLDVLQADGVLALDPQLEHQPVRQVDQILVEHGEAAEDGRLAVVDAVRVGARVVDPVGVLPLGCAPGAQVAVARRGQRLAQALLVGVEACVGHHELVHGTSPPTRAGPTVGESCGDAGRSQQQDDRRVGAPRPAAESSTPPELS
jgi:hypothetical protein